MTTGPGISVAESFARLDLSRLREKILSASEEDFMRALSLPPHRLGLEDFCALLSDFGRDRLELLARRSHSVTRLRFGPVVGLYAPIYLSNHCSGGCRYCGFGGKKDAGRKRLTLSELETELDILRARGFSHVLLVAGADPRLREDGFLEKAVSLAHGKMPSVSVEIETLAEENYRALVSRGLDGLVVYQETYDRALYGALHPSGPKRDYFSRLLAPESGARAGLRRVGTGVLLGLCPWREDVLSLAVHLKLLIARYWRVLFTASLPRFKSAGVDFSPAHPVDDVSFTQALCALRIFFPDTPLYLSTREPARLRDGLVHCGVTHLSAGSKTNPGGYSGLDEQTSSTQFDVSDPRGPEEIAAMLRAAGLEPVWKDWEGVLNDHAQR